MIVLKIIGIVVGALVGLFFLGVFLTWICTLFVDVKKEYTEDSSFYRGLLHFWTFFAVIVFRIHIKTEGMEKLPKGRFLLVQNHRSSYDPILTWHIMRQYQLAFISKEENFKVPFFGKIIRRCCFRAIDRENPRNALKTIIDCAELIKNDTVSIAVYPEGTRNKEWETTPLLPFHNGVFKIAQRAGVPVVVTTIEGTEAVKKNLPFHSSQVTFRVLEVMDIEPLLKEKSEVIGEHAEQLMCESLTR